MALSARDTTTGFAARVLGFLQRVLLWAGGIVFTALAAIMAFFIAAAALIGSFILGGAIAFAWFVFRIFGNKNTKMHQGFYRSRSSGNNPRKRTNSKILDATPGPDGWTVEDRGPFGR